MASLLEEKVWPVVVAFHILFGQTTNGLSASLGLDFQSDPSYDDLKVSTDVDSLDLTTLTSTRCAVSCGHHAWCTSFFFTKGSGLCSLHATVFWGGAGYATASPGTRYFRNVADWCRPNLERMYNRPSEMCVFFEFETNNMVSSWTFADAACITMGGRLASNLTPLKMDALVNMTEKNPTIDKSLFIGLKRQALWSEPLEWVDGQPLDTAALASYWEVNQPNGQDCVVIRASVDSTLNDVYCNDSPQPFVCEFRQQ